MKNSPRILLIGTILFSISLKAQKTDLTEIELVTTDIDHFWEAYDQAKPDFAPEAFDEWYLGRASKGLKGFIKNRIQSGEYLSRIIKKRPNYYASLRASSLQITSMKDSIRSYFRNLRNIYPDAEFSPVYIVVGAMNSGGTTSRNGIIIGADLYGLTSETDMAELTDWHKTVLKSVDEIPHIVAHELIHIQQKYRGNNLSLLGASIREGSADFIGELISGRHINQHVHDFANPGEKELWAEFKARMFEKDYKGWLYSSQEGRPNDLGYWIGYKITKAYYDQMNDKQQAIEDILRIKDFEDFLVTSGYARKFE
jgi:hypothetical protein